MSEQLSIDIEACGEIVLSIGACKFDPDSCTQMGRFDALGATFYCTPSVKEQLKAGLRMDAEAFHWWLKQSEAARLAIVTPGESVKEALRRFEDFAQPHGMPVWAYPTSYDLPILARLCATFGVRVPWKWTETMDARTLWKLAMKKQPGIERIETENPTPHHALEDAKEQARWIMAYLKVVVL